MIEYTLIQKAHIMSYALKVHKRGKSILNWRLALDMGLAETEEDAKLLCHDIGLSGGWGENTDFSHMELYINKNKSK